MARPMFSGKKRANALGKRHGIWSKQPCKDCRDNVGKGHLPAGANGNLQRPFEIAESEVKGRILVWRMSPYE
jgi:hypothetical protein